MTWTTASRALRAAWLDRILSKCVECGRFKSRPSSTCGTCGRCDVGVGEDPYSYDRDRGFYR